MFSYSASGPMTIYFIDEGVVELEAMSGVPLAPLYAALKCDTTNLTDMAHSTAEGAFMSVDQTIISIQGSGSFSGNFDPFQNPWNLVVIAPSTSAVPPSLTLTYGPIESAFTMAETTSFPTVAVESSTTILTFSAVSEVPFMQTYGWLVGGVIVVILALVAVWFTLKTRTTHHPKQATLTQYVKPIPTTCVKCGAELPPASTFCNKCGAKQE